MIIIIDNYDSFTYNLYQYIGEISPEIEVYRNDKITVKEVYERKPSHIIISPGPGFPGKAGICEELVRALGPSIPVLGVCLGHQAIGEAYGARIVKAPELVHGKASKVTIQVNCKLFEALTTEIYAGRYHSLIVDESSLPPELIVTAVSQDGLIMGLKHREYDIYGIQFHPESVLTPDGKTILYNFLNISGQEYSKQEGEGSV
jgi:anthranilate synthase component II